MNKANAPRASAISLLPLMLFLSLFIGVGSYLHFAGHEFAFYQLPAPVAILPAVVLAIMLSKDKLNQSIEHVIDGMAHRNIITMCAIYLLAGAFSSVSAASGGIDAVVTMALMIIPPWFLLPGIFIVAGIIATAMGTSMGTIAAVAPIALGLASSAGIDPILMAGAVLGGAMFGDNLSIISDTTIAATRTQGCEMRDKFNQNVAIAVPAALLTMLILFIQGDSTPVAHQELSHGYTALPYVVILVLAISGVNVFAVLSIGIVLAGLAAFSTGGYSLLSYGQDIYQGFGKMQEIFLLSLFIGGLSELMRRQGGLAFLQQQVEKLVKRFRQAHTGAQFGIAATTALTNIGVANNTVAILVSAEVNKQLAQQHHVSPARSASIMDIYACVVQGLLPYGAQALLLGSLFSLSPLQVISNAWYPLILALVAAIVIIRRRKPA